MRVSCVSSSTLQLLLEPHNGFGEVMRPGTLAGATGRRGETPRAKLAPAVSFVSQTVLCLSFGIHAPILTDSRVSQLCHFTKLHVIRVNLYGTRLRSNNSGSSVAQAPQPPFTHTQSVFGPYSHSSNTLLQRPPYIMNFVNSTRPSKGARFETGPQNRASVFDAI